MERWWDGNAWTEYTRTAPTPSDAPPAYPVYPGYPVGYHPGEHFPDAGGKPRRKRRTAIAIAVAVVVIGGLVASAVAFGSGGSGGSNDNNDAKGVPAPAATTPNNRPTDPGHDGTPNLPGGPESPGGPAIDAYDGIRLPVLDGWQGASGTQGIGASIVTGGYPCPTDPTQNCVRGGAFAQPAKALKLTSTTAEAAAKEDIAPNAAESYSPDIYGATTSHQVVASKAVDVADQKGYLVRWKISTKSGTDGYVESLAFPAPSDGGKLVVIRFGFDIGGKAPGLDVMDQITEGIKADSSGHVGGGTGTGV